MFSCEPIVWCVFLWCVTASLVRVCFVIPVFAAASETDGKCDTTDGPMQDFVLFVLLGSGGHTGEMLRLLEHYRGLLLEKPCHVTVHVGYSDENSLHKFRNKIASRLPLGAHVEYHRFHKARGVGSSLAGSVGSVVQTLIKSSLITCRIKRSMSGKPNLTLLNGPGTCCMITLWMKLYHIFGGEPSRIVYVESLARTNRLSLTGKIVYPFADEFVVQWPDLLAEYPRAKYYGILV